MAIFNSYFDITRGYPLCSNMGTSEHPPFGGWSPGRCTAPLRNLDCWCWDNWRPKRGPAMLWQLWEEMGISWGFHRDLIINNGDYDGDMASNPKMKQKFEYPWISHKHVIMVVYENCFRHHWNQDLLLQLQDLKSGPRLPKELASLRELSLVSLKHDVYFCDGVLVTK